MVWTGYPTDMDAQHLSCEVTRCPACGRRSMVVTYEGLADPANPARVAVWMPTHGSCEHGCNTAQHVLPGLAQEAA